ncbi:MAG: hypothetical protein ACTHLE_09720 [Agriterribacter sp.]
MTFIFVVKVFHAHGNHSCADASAKVKLVDRSCAICEYHFTKDADNSQVVITIQSPAVFLVSNAGKVSDYTFHISRTTLLRGPPFFS